MLPRERTLSSSKLVQHLNLLPPEETLENSEVLNKFRERIRTYVKDQRWVRQQQSFFPTVCAQYGWKCISNEQLQCETCYAHLPISIPKINDFGYKAYINDTLERLKSRHKKNCPWSVLPCPDHYVHIYPMHKEEAYQLFVVHLKSLYSLQEKLPCIEEGVAEKLSLSDEVCSSLCRISYHAETNFSKSAVLLSATGWVKDTKVESNPCLLCKSCQRSVPLLLYVSVASNKSKCQRVQDSKPEEISDTKVDSSDDHSSARNRCVESVDMSNSEASAQNGYSTRTIRNNNHTDKKQTDHNNCFPNKEQCCDESNQQKNKGATRAFKETRPESANGSVQIKIDSHFQSPVTNRRKRSFDIKYFNPLFEHRPWCPWVIESGCNSETHNNSFHEEEKVLGWQLFITCLLRNTGYSDSSNTDAPLKDRLRHARYTLESWREPGQER